MNQNYMKEKPVFPLLVSMALPMILSMLVNSLYNIVDSFFVAKISEDAMTALSLVYPVQNFITSVAVGFGVGIAAVISMNLGAKNQTAANTAASKGLMLSAVHGIVIMIGTISMMPSFLGIFTSEKNVIELGLRYSNIAFSFSLIIMLGITYEKIFQSVGKMKVTMIGLAGGCLVNIILDPLLIFGIGIFPAMGMEGAAIATGIGQVSSLIIYLVFYKTKPIPVEIKGKYVFSKSAPTSKLYLIGIPATLNMALPSLTVSCLNGILAAYSQSYVVILGLYYKLQTFIYLPANGLVQGMRPVIGYNFGAGEHARVKKIFEVSLGMCASIMLLGMVLCLLIPGRLVGMFSTNPDTIHAGETALRVICAGFVVSAISVTSCGALEGLGKGGESLVISVCRYVAVILPAAFVLSRFFGTMGVWNAFWVSELISAVVAALVYRRALKAEAAKQSEE